MIEESNIPPFEILKLEEFAKRLEVGRSTIFDWKSNGVLKAGLHYFQRGKVLRFIWARDLILSLDNAPAVKPEAGESTPEKADVDIPPDKTGPRKVGINWDY